MREQGRVTAPPEMTAEAVRGRIRDARRNGFASWLWPDISVERWRAAMSDVTNATREMLGDGKQSILIGQDASALCLAGYTSGMGPLLGFWIEQGQLGASDDVAAMFRLQLAHNRTRMVVMADAAQKVLMALSDTDVAATIIKGMHTAFSYFPDPGTRPLTDIDMYISNGHMASADRVLSGLGYEPELHRCDPYMCDWVLPSLRREPHTLMYLHRDDSWSFDVQASLNRSLPTGVRIGLDVLIATSDGQTWPLCPAGRILSQPLLALLLAAHVGQGLHNATLLRISELVLVIQQDTATGLLNWDAFLSAADKIGGRRFAYPALLFCEQLAPGTVPDEVLSACQADAPANLRALLSTLSVAELQPLGRRSLRGRFMWAGNWRETLRQVAYELALDRQGRAPARIYQSIGNKFWALSRGRLGT